MGGPGAKPLKETILKFCNAVADFRTRVGWRGFVWNAKVLLNYFRQPTKIRSWSNSFWLAAGSDKAFFRVALSSGVMPWQAVEF